MIMTKAEYSSTVKDCCKYDEHSDPRILVWDSSGSKWVHRYKPMPTARSSPVAVSYKKYLIVMGGSSGMDDVEVLDTSSNHQYHSP